jgi:SNF2 family DNA or RNA helicase
MQLYPYQEQGAAFLAERGRAYNADGMGLGKTVQAMHATQLVKAKRVLWIGPASTLPNVQHEWPHWGYSPAMFYATSYEKVARNPGHWTDLEPDTVIVDEAHYCKTRTAQRTIAALSVARAAKRAWLLSGTPMPNNPSELWPPVRVLWGNITRSLRIGSYADWLNRFCRWEMTEYGPKIWGSQNLHELKPHLQRIMIRRRVEDVGLQLPPLRVDMQLLPRDARLEEALLQAGWTRDAAQFLERQMVYEESTEEASLSRLRRILGTYKAARVGELLKEELRTKQYRKIVVLAYHHDVISILGQVLEPFGVVTLTGSTLPKRRQAAIDEFTKGRARVFLGQQTAAGVGLNLQVANEVVLVEPSWSPEDNAQAIKRVHRIGSTAPCRARIFSVEDSLDQGVMEVCARKTRMRLELGL